MVPENWSPAMRLETYQHMAKHVGPSGPVRALGVCNFSLGLLKQLMAFCEEKHLPKPAVVQNEYHPYLVADDVRLYCQEQGIVFQVFTCFILYY